MKYLMLASFALNVFLVSRLNYQTNADTSCLQRFFDAKEKVFKRDLDFNDRLGTCFVIRVPNKKQKLIERLEEEMDRINKVLYSDLAVSLTSEDRYIRYISAKMIKEGKL